MKLCQVPRALPSDTAPAHLLPAWGGPAEEHVEPGAGLGSQSWWQEPASLLRRKRKEGFFPERVRKRAAKRLRVTVC